MIARGGVHTVSDCVVGRGSARGWGMAPLRFISILFVWVTRFVYIVVRVGRCSNAAPLLALYCMKTLMMHHGIMHVLSVRLART